MSIHPTRKQALAGRAGRLAAAMLALALLCGANAIAADTDGPAAAPAIVSAAPGSVAQAPDLGQALQAVVADARARLRVIAAAAKSAEGPERTAELAAEATAVHAQMKRRLLEVQLEYAQAAGNAALAAELEGILARLDHPAAGVPQARPVPSSADAAAPGAR